MEQGELMRLVVRALESDWASCLGLTEIWNAVIKRLGGK